MDIFAVSDCNIAQTIGEISRFVFHIVLLHFCTAMIDDNEHFFNKKIYSSIFITAMAVMCYHLFVRKLVEPHLEKMKYICNKSVKHRKSHIKLVT